MESQLSEEQRCQWITHLNEKLNEFCKFAKSNFPPDAVVDKVKVKDYTGYVPKIEALTKQDNFLYLYSVLFCCFENFLFDNL